MAQGRKIKVINYSLHSVDLSVITSMGKTHTHTHTHCHVTEEGAGPLRLKMGILPWLKITWVLQLGLFR